MGQTLMGTGNTAAGWIGSIIGAIILLALYRLVIGRRRTV
ncbi:MAG TPA: GlsB/YeaQ/YmgE family stress response membrane protein [Thermoanaerobaculia bacterium]|nr:GlsB/YeaQ/YmgE family stress response membrane protein [Thermoanaerobaculia bacterium]